ncbi:MAG: DAK2 domain-containing protein [Clostridiales bacterium]|nr:DAK2 domain-containing protein [Clostridiales bacterium]
METRSLDGRLYARLIEGGAARLNTNRVIVNELNVFPIPDGDTGDNMYMTIDSGFSAVAGSVDEELGTTSERIAKGMLLGARGNSGVILSRIFAGISKGFGGMASADVPAFAKAMEKGVAESYKAVQTPVEGTILTVYSDAVKYANSRIAADSDFESYFSDLLDELRASLDRTPDLLAVLKEAGVVDSGGAGFVYIAEGMKDALDGVSDGRAEAAAPKAKAVDTSSFTEDSVLEFGYCTEFLLRLQTAKVGPLGEFDEKPLLDWLIKNGESVVAFRDGSVIKVHVHSMEPERILAHCHEYGEFLTMKIENMMLQHNETTVRNNYSKPQKPRKKFGIVAVAAGEGIKDTFISLGADAVVDGGQSMNPSAESFLSAFESTNADNILVFPNNSNIILTARQAAALYEKANVRVIPSRSIGECYAALSMLDVSSGDIDEIEKGSVEIMESVVTGTVSKACRNTERDGVSVKEGDYIGFSNGVIYSDSADPVEASVKLAEALNADDFGILMLVCGKDTEIAVSEAVKAALEKAHRRTEVILLDGGQPIYDYIMILE